MGTLLGIRATSPRASTSSDSDGSRDGCDRVWGEIEHTGAMPVRPQLRVAVWGARHIHTQDHIAAVRAHPRATLAGINTDASHPPTDVDAVLLDGLTGNHAKQLRQLPPSMPVFVEKPLALDPSAAETVAGLLTGRVHGTGLFLHHVPALQQWLEVARNAPEVHLNFGHTARTDGAFDDPRYTWMLDPVLSGGGSFMDLGIHLAHLLQLLWPSADLAKAEVQLVPDHDRLDSDVGGRATLTFSSGQVAHLQTSSVSGNGVHLTATTSDGAWVTAGGVLRHDDVHVLDGPPPNAQTAVTAFLDAMTGSTSTLRVAPASELLDAHRLLAATLSSAPRPRTREG